MTIEIAQGFHVEVDEDEVGYQLIGPGGEESGITAYHDTAEVEVNGKTYEVTVDSKEDALEDPPELYLRLDEVPAVEEVEFDLEDEEEEEEEEGEDEEEEEGTEDAPDAA